MRDTPRVDAVLMCMSYPAEDQHSERYKAVIALARKLEREVYELQAEVEERREF